jgi:hypothetical protein
MVKNKLNSLLKLGMLSPADRSADLKEVGVIRHVKMIFILMAIMEMTIRLLPLLCHVHVELSGGLASRILMKFERCDEKFGKYAMTMNRDAHEMPSAIWL